MTLTTIPPITVTVALPISSTTIPPASRTTTSPTTRIREEKMAVVNFLANVQLVVDGHDVSLKMSRLEVVHKTANGWCRVAGRGTEVDEQLFPVKTNQQK